MQFSSHQMRQIQNFPGAATEGVCSTPPYLLAGGEGARCPLPNPPCPSVLERRWPFGPHTQHTYILFHGAAYGHTV